MARTRKPSAILSGILLAALAGGSAFAAFADGNVVVGALFSVVSLAALGAGLRGTSEEGRSLRRDVLWAGVGFSGVGICLIGVIILEDTSMEALAWFSGLVFIGLGLFSFYLLRRLAGTDQNAPKSVDQGYPGPQ